MKHTFKTGLKFSTVLLIVVLAIAGITILLLRSAVRDAMTVQKDIAQAKQALVARDFGQAGQYLRTASVQLQAIKKDLRRVSYLQIVPWVSPRYKAGRALVDAGGNAFGALAQVAQEISAVQYILKKNGTVKIGALAREERQKILASVENAVPPLKQARLALTHAQGLALGNPRLSLISVMTEQVGQFLDQGLPLLEVLPRILGVDEPKTYLFVLQNSDEMRPTGGFIGTYGLITLDAGHITNFFTDDVYNLDRLAPPARRPKAPAQLARYLQQPAWYLRDANWDPDFPTTAQKILQFYKEEKPAQTPPVAEFQSGKGEKEKIDGVLAIMPEAIRPLLRLTGPITIAGQTFTAENLTDVLEYEVEIGFEKKGIPRPQRKEIVAKLGHELISKTLALPPEKWGEALRLVREALDEKHILTYSTDSTLEQMLSLHQWSGDLAAAPQDSLAVFDANLFSLKTDPYISRSIFYRISRGVGGELIGDLELVYTYPKSGPSWKTKGYRTWTRVYVPEGSILSSASGAMDEEKSNQSGRVEVQKEHSHTVFGAFLAVQVGETRRLRFTYRLPEYVARRVEQEGVYELLVQKQAGTVGHNLTIAIDLDKVPRIWGPRGLGVARDENSVTWQSSLRRNQQFRVEF